MIARRKVAKAKDFESDTIEDIKKSLDINKRICISLNFMAYKRTSKFHSNGV